MVKINYSFWIGLGKTIKNSAVLLIPFLIAVMAGLPVGWSLAVGPLVYFLKNIYEVKTGKKI